MNLKDATSLVVKAIGPLRDLVQDPAKRADMDAAITGLRDFAADTESDVAGAVRSKIDELMPDALNQFQSKIDDLLDDFRTSASSHVGDTIAEHAEALEARVHHVLSAAKTDLVTEFEKLKADLAPAPAAVAAAAEEPAPALPLQDRSPEASSPEVAPESPPQAAPEPAAPEEPGPAAEAATEPS